MKTFEEFVADREKMDPSAQKMSEHQWQQAYGAYRSSRQLVRKKQSQSKTEGSLSESSSSVTRAPEGGELRQRSKQDRAPRRNDYRSESKSIRSRVRQSSAYSDVRVIVDVLFWVAIAVIIASTLLKMLLEIGVLTLLSYLIEGALGVIVLFVLKLLAQVFIDIPDTALYQQDADRIGSSEKMTGRR